MKIINITFSLGIMLIMMLACEDTNEVNYHRDAKLIWTGEYDVDGCGFFVEIDSVQYKPENEGIISPFYKTIEPLSVTIQFIDLLYDMEYHCGDLPNSQKTKAIKLISMDLNEELPEN